MSGVNIDSLFKLPSVPLSKNKRKLPDAPDAAYLQKLRAGIEDDDDVDDLSVVRSSKVAKTSSGTDSGTINYDEDDDGNDGGGRFAGDGLSDEQRKILELVDLAEEVCAKRRAST